MALSPVSSRSTSSPIVQLFDSTLSGDAATIDTGAAGVAATYNHLRILIYARTAEAAVLSALGLRFNNDSAGNYDTQRVSGRNATASAITSLAQTEVQLAASGATATASAFSSLAVDVLAYAQTTGHKSAVSIAGAVEATAADGNAETRAHRWRSTVAISRVALFVVGGSNLVAGSRMTIYGIT